MSGKMAQGKKHYADELKEMIQERGASESVDEVLAVFCQRHGISLEECKKYHDQVAAELDEKEEED